MSGICLFSGEIVSEVGNAGDSGVGSDTLCVVSKGWSMLIAPGTLCLRVGSWRDCMAQDGGTVVGGVDGGTTSLRELKNYRRRLGQSVLDIGYQVA